jgi:DNA-binding MarR family transcriptional regulator
MEPAAGFTSLAITSLAMYRQRHDCTALHPGLAVTDLSAGELIMLGRQLARIGTEAMRGVGRAAIPAGQGMVAADVFAHPATSVGEIADRTGLRQSYVSESVARLRRKQVVETSTDPADGRRTLVRLTPGHPATVTRAAAVPAGQALARALGDPAPGELTEITGVLAALASRLRPPEPGPVGPHLAPRPDEPE